MVQQHAAKWSWVTQDCRQTSSVTEMLNELQDPLDINIPGLVSPLHSETFYTIISPFATITAINNTKLLSE